jgi:hypothetical protein
VSRSKPFIIAPTARSHASVNRRWELLALAILQRAKQMRGRLGHVVAAHRAG